MGRRRWADLGPRQRTLLGTATIVQFALLAAALVDIRRRPDDQIKGSKRVWTALSFINFVGPVSYFVFGRRK